jgi:hypothetical protein
MPLTQKTIAGNIASVLKPDERFGTSIFCENCLVKAEWEQVWLADETFTASWDDTARIWDATTGKELQALE